MTDCYPHKYKMERVEKPEPGYMMSCENCTRRVFRADGKDV